MGYREVLLSCDAPQATQLNGVDDIGGDKDCSNNLNSN